jgi:hypothetical protein
MLAKNQEGFLSLPAGGVLKKPDLFQTSALHTN